MPEITAQWERFSMLPVTELYKLLRFRQNIFVVEQRSPYPDLDSFGDTIPPGQPSVGAATDPSGYECLPPRATGGGVPWPN